MLSTQEKKKKLDELGVQYEIAKRKGDTAGMNRAHAAADLIRKSEGWKYNEKTGETYEQKSMMHKPTVITSQKSSVAAPKTKTEAAAKSFSSATPKTVMQSAPKISSYQAKTTAAQTTAKKTAAQAETKKQQQRQTAIQAHIASLPNNPQNSTASIVQRLIAGQGPRTVQQAQVKLPSTEDVIRSLPGLSNFGKIRESETAEALRQMRMKENMPVLEQIMRSAGSGIAADFASLGETSVAAVKGAGKNLDALGGLRRAVTTPLNQAEEIIKRVEPSRIDENSTAMRLARDAAQYRDLATKDMGSVGKFLTDTGISIAQSAPGMALSLLHPAAGAAYFGATATGGRALELQQQGESAGDALVRGGLSGAIEAATEKFSIDNFLKAGRSAGGVRQLIRNVLRQAGVEASEEGASYAANYLADKAAGDPNATFTLAELAAQMGGGAISGGIFGGIGSGIGFASNAQEAQRVRSVPDSSNNTQPFYRPETQAPLQKSVNELSPVQRTQVQAARPGMIVPDDYQPGILRQGTWQEGEVRPQLRPEYEERPQSSYQSPEENEILQQQLERYEQRLEGSQEEQIIPDVARRTGTVPDIGEFAVPDPVRVNMPEMGNTQALGRENSESSFMPQNQTEELIAAYRAVEAAERNVERVREELTITDNDMRYVRAALETGSTSNFYEADNPQDVLYLFEAMQAVEDARAPIRRYQSEHIARLRALASEAAENIAQFGQDKRIRWNYQLETMERNMRDVLKKSPEAAEQIIDTYFTPVHKSVAQANRYKNNMRKQVAALKLSREESTLVQYLLEGESAAASEYAAGHPGADITKVQQAVPVFQRLYEQLYNDLNAALVRGGYEPIHARKNYAPHFTEGQAQTLLGRVLYKMGLHQPGQDNIPTDLAGITETFRPGKQWFGNLLERRGEQTVYDAVRGFDQYIETAANVIHLTEDIERLRELEDGIRYRLSDEGTQDLVDSIRAEWDLDPLERRKRIEEAYEQQRTGQSGLVTELRRYTDNLAGKKSRDDRAWEDKLGRDIYQLAKNVEGRIAGNMVALNPGSWLTNIIPLTQASGEIGPIDLLRGMRDTVKAYGRDDGFVNASTFLTNRRGSQRLNRTTAQRVGDVLSSPMEWIDQFTADTIVRARTAQNMRAGLALGEAIDEADAFAAGLMADRSKGATPTAFNATNPVARVFTMFQIEVNNQLRYLGKDLPRRLGEQGAAAVAGALTKIFLGAYLYNAAYSQLTGRDAALDPIGIVLDAFGMDPLDPPEEDEEKPQPQEIAGSIATSVAENTPFLGGLIGGGRVPIQSAIPDVPTLISTLLDPEKAGAKKKEVAVKELSKPLYYIGMPVAGGAIKKAVEAGQMIRDGGVYSVNNEGEQQLNFPYFSDNGIPQDVQAILFGRYATPAGRAYVESGFQRLSAEQTAAYDYLRGEMGADDRTSYETIRKLSEISGNKDEEGKTIMTTRQARQEYLYTVKGLTPEQKATLDSRLVSTSENAEAADYTDRDAFLISVYAPDKAEEIAEAQTFGIDTQQYIDLQRALSGFETVKDADGNIVERESDLRRDAIMQTDLTPEQKAFADRVFNDTEHPADYSSPERYYLTTWRDADGDTLSESKIEQAEELREQTGMSYETFTRIKSDLDLVEKSVNDEGKETADSAYYARIRSQIYQIEGITGEQKAYLDTAYTRSKCYELAQNAYAAGIPYEQFLRAFGTAYYLESDRDANGNSLKNVSPKKKAAIDAVEGLNSTQRRYLYEQFGVAKSYWSSSSSNQSGSKKGRSGTSNKKSTSTGGTESTIRRLVGWNGSLPSLPNWPGIG